MTQERAELNWYHSPTDYYSVRARKVSSEEETETQRGLTAQQAKAGPTHETQPGEFTFDDFLDIINPLHHFPVISSLYREVTGDQISAHARILGGGLYGGGTGFFSSIANAISEEASGRDIGENLVAAVFGEDEGGSDVLVARGGTQVETTPSAGTQADRAQADRAQAHGGAKASAEGPLESTAGSGSAKESEALTGDAALSALFADVRRRDDRDAAPPTPSPSPSGLGGIAPHPTAFASQEWTRTPSQGDRNPRDRSREGFADQMLLGLQKYEEMVRRQPDATERARL